MNAWALLGKQIVISGTKAVAANAALTAIMVLATKGSKEALDLTLRDLLK